MRLKLDSGLPAIATRDANRWGGSARDYSERTSRQRPEGR